MTHTITISTIAGAAASTALKEATKRIAADAAVRQIGLSASKDPFADSNSSAPSEVGDQIAQIDALMSAAAQNNGVKPQPWGLQMVDEPWLAWHWLQNSAPPALSCLHSVALLSRT